MQAIEVRREVSAALLKPRGRLVFFLPTVTDEYEELDIDTMLCDGMEVVANSLQNFGSWGRRVCLSAVVFLRVGHLIMSRGLCSSSPYGKRLMSSICLLHSHRRLTSPIVCKRTHLRIRISGKSISSGSENRSLKRSKARNRISKRHCMYDSVTRRQTTNPKGIWRGCSRVKYA